MNLADELTRQAQARPAATAIRLPAKNLSFQQLEALTWQVARHLQQSGVKPGDIVALSFADELTLLVALLATALLGATAFSLPLHLPALRKSEMARQARANFVAGDRDNASLAELPFLPVELDRLAASAEPASAAVRAPSPQAPFLIIYGSGSTGAPRLLMVSHAQFLARTRIGGTMLSLSPADRLASLSPMVYTSPTERSLAALFAGASLALFDRRRLDPLADCMKLGVTVLDATVIHLEQILAALPRGSRNRLGFLRRLQVSHSTVNDGLRQRVAKALTPALQVRYGTNEAGPISFAAPNEVLKTPGTVGRPPADIQIEIVDGREQPLPAGTTGLIRVASPGMIDGYLDDEPASRGVFRKGWFYPGDLGRLDTSGQLIFCGRADQMMIMDGINIYPAEIERTLSQHPAVCDVAAIPLPSSSHQDLPVCAVVVHEGTRVTERDLLDFARQRLGAHGPRKLAILDRIPRNEQGKPLRSQLVQEIDNKLRQQEARQSVRPAARRIFGPEVFAGLRQPGRELQLVCRIPLPTDPGLIDDWLQSTLKIELLPCDSLAGRPDDTALGQRIALTWRVLLLFSQLMQAARIPIFAPGRVLRIAPDRAGPAAWTASVAVAQIDHLPEAAYATAGTEAARLVEWMALRPRTPVNIAELFGMLQKQVIPPLQRLFSSGKSTLHVLRAAYVQDIPFAHLGAGIFQLGWGCRARRIDRSTTDADPASGAKLAQNKVWSANLLRLAGLPAPLHGLAGNEQEALRIARRIGWPVVVKPVDRDRGEGITVGIRNDNQLHAALKAAGGLSRNRKLIVEREVGGVCHRLFVARQQLLYAVKRLPKSVHGDGQRTVAELIQAANEQEAGRPPWRRTEPYPDDALALEAMTAAGFSRESIPAAGVRVPLRDIESTAAGGFDEDVTAGIHPDNLNIALRAAALFGLDVAGIDIITPDIGRPWHENGAIINEVNYAPLLGGGEISRSHVPEFLARIVEGDGRIPVEAFLGGTAALTAARQRQGELVAKGTACFLTNHAKTVAPAGEEMPQPFEGLYQRCTALLMDQRAETILLVVQTAELLRTGLPVDRISRVATCERALSQPAPPGAFERLHTLLCHHADNPSH